MIRIRGIEEADCKAVAALEKDIFSQPWSEQGFLDAIKMDNTIFLLAEEEGDCLGYIGMYLSLEEGEITNVAVAPEKRGLGIGDALLKESIARAKEKGIAQIVLEVRVSNEAAIHLYEKNGFKSCGIRKGFYEFPKEDAHIMIYNQ